MKFQKGQSGNPSGRPKENPVLKEIARANSEHAFMRVLTLVDSSDERVALAASREVLDRAWGKPEVKGEMEVTHKSIVRVPEKAPTAEIWQQQHSQATSTVN